MIYCVDLDGTLSKGDMSLRAFVYLSIRNPLWIVKAAFYLLAKFGDRKLLKSKMNEHYKFKVEDLYFNEELINFLKEVKNDSLSKNSVYLISGSSDEVVKKIAQKFTFFDGAFGSRVDVNLISSNKLSFIKKMCPNQDLCYIGNSKADFKVWSGVQYGIVVSDKPSFIEEAKKHTEIIKVISPKWSKITTFS